MSNKVYMVQRNLTLNGNLIEVERPFGVFNDRKSATERAEALTDSVALEAATRGLCFTFYVRELEVSG